MDCRDRGSHARGVYPTHDTSRMGTARVKQEEETHENNSNRVRKMKERNMGTVVGKSPKQGLTRVLRVSRLLLP